MSDIDIAVLLNNPEAYNLKNLILDLIFDFSRVFCSDKIDLVILSKASLAVQYNVISDGKILYELDPETRYNYEGILLVYIWILKDMKISTMKQCINKFLRIYTPND